MNLKVTSFPKGYHTAKVAKTSQYFFYTYMALVSTLWNVGNKARATDTPKMDKATKFNHKVLQEKN